MRRLPFLFVLATAACAPATRPASPAPVPTSAPAPATRPAIAPTPLEAARDWHLLDATTDGVVGISLRRAERELLGGRAPARTIVVAVLDGGTDTTHADLRPQLWSNPREVGGNGRDDDNNGYADDTRGWNFLGGPGGDVHHETLEITRLHAQCLANPAAPGADSVRARCAQIATTWAAKRAELDGQMQQVRQVEELLQRTERILRTVTGPDSLTARRVEAIVPANDSVRNARLMYLRIIQSGITPAAIAEAKEQLGSQLEYGYNLQYDPRRVVGDNPADLSERRYGSALVMGPDPKHGTHVAGIIGAARDGAGIDGVAAGVSLMTVRVVPDGDERDKDVANGIRYAVDNGAHIINMSFGKGFSPQKPVVDEAVRYAVSKGVLLVHAAGNDGADLAVEPSFPTATLSDGTTAATWIEVGASSWKGGSQLAAPFTNYGKNRVDVFAPGVDILSTVPGGGWDRESGTSMAAPVVSGLAAFLMSHFPALTAADVKRIILSSATSFADLQVDKPGDPATKVRFGDLSRTGGVVNAWEAVRAAQALTRPVP